MIQQFYNGGELSHHQAASLYNLNQSYEPQTRASASLSIYLILIEGMKTTTKGKSEEIVTELILKTNKDPAERYKRQSYTITDHIPFKIPIP